MTKPNDGLTPAELIFWECIFSTRMLMRTDLVSPTPTLLRDQAHALNIAIIDDCTEIADLAVEARRAAEKVWKEAFDDENETPLS